MLILSIKVSEPINITFPNHSSYSSISVPWNTAPQNMRPPRQYWHSPLLTGNFVQLDGQGGLSNILTASLPAEQATSKMKSRWAASSTSRSDDRPALSPHQATQDGTPWSCDWCFHKLVRTYPSKRLLFSRGSPKKELELFFSSKSLRDPSLEISQFPRHWVSKT